MRNTLALCILAVSILAVPVSAHHAAGLVYDTAREVTIEGVVTRFELGNPHMRIYITRPDLPDDDTEWMAEGGSRTVLVRRGWTNDRFRPGDRISLHGHASRDDRPIFHVTDIETADGEAIRAEDAISDTLIDDLRQRRRRD